MAVYVCLIKPFPLRSVTADRELWGQYNGGIARYPCDAAAAADLVHASVQTLFSTSTARDPSMTNTGTKTHIPPLFFSLTSTTRDLGIGTAPSTGKWDKGVQRYCHRC